MGNDCERSRHLGPHITRGDGADDDDDDDWALSDKRTYSAYDRRRIAHVEHVTAPRRDRLPELGGQ
jgi:hypothetical protein